MSVTIGLNSTPEPEPFVDQERAAAFLSIPPRYLLDLARRGQLPGHPLGTGTRKVWRFRLSELAAAVIGNSSTPKPEGRGSVESVAFRANHKERR